MGTPAPAENAEPPRPAAELDCRGLYCPLPVLRTARALSGLAVGQVLRVVTTDPVAEIDMAVFSQRSGHSLMRRERRGDELVFWFRRAPAGPGCYLEIRYRWRLPRR